MVNIVFLIGNLGADPKLITSKNGLTVTNFNIATFEHRIDKAGNKQSQTEWHRIVAFNRLGDICGKYLTKGIRVYVEGRLQTTQWLDRDGNKIYTTKIVAKLIKFLTPKTLNIERNLPSQKEDVDFFEEQDEIWDDVDWADNLGCDEDEVENFFESQMC